MPDTPIVEEKIETLPVPPESPKPAKSAKASAEVLVRMIGYRLFGGKRLIYETNDPSKAYLVESDFVEFNLKKQSVLRSVLDSATIVDVPEAIASQPPHKIREYLIRSL